MNKKRKVNLFSLSGVKSRKEWIGRVSKYEYIHIPKLEKTKPMNYPSWLAIMHEKIHDKLGHAMRSGKETRAQVVAEEKEVWIIQSMELRSIGKWNNVTKQYAVAGLSNYMLSVQKAKDFVDKL